MVLSFSKNYIALIQHASHIIKEKCIIFSPKRILF